MSLTTPMKTVLNSSQNSSHDGSFTSKLDLSGYNTSPATRPVGRDNKAGWYGMHEKHEIMAKRSGLEYILCGDSIIAGLSRYIDVWRKFFAPLRALNLGIGGDRTQHVLWRAENLHISSTTKFVVLHCGTNNIDRDTASCIANGILSIAVTFQEKVPGLKVLVTGLLPRDLEQNSFRREKIVKVNKMVKRMCRTKFDNIFFMKQDEDWVMEDGQLDESLYFNDHLHLIEKGNNKLASSITKSLEQIKDEGSLVYSSDEEGSETDEEYQYQRLISQKRKRDRESCNDDDDYRRTSRRSSSSLRKRRRHSDTHRHSNSRRRRRSTSLSPSSSRHRQKHSHSHHGTSASSSRHRVSTTSSRRHQKKEDSDESHDEIGNDNDDTSDAEDSGSGSGGENDNGDVSKWNTVRKVGVTTHKNKKQSEKQTKNGEEEVQGGAKKKELLGTAKSIDITMDKQKRLEARRNKFSAPALGPSSLIQKIQRSQKEARKNLERSPNNNSDKKEVKDEPELSNDEMSEKIETKKFFSDFTADSDPE